MSSVYYFVYHVPSRDFSLLISSDARATDKCLCAKNSTYSLPCPLSPFSLHFVWISSKRGALTSSHQEYQTSPQLWWTFWWEWKKEKCTHQLCKHVLDGSGCILRFVFKSKTNTHLLWYASTEKQLLFLCGFVGFFSGGFSSIWMGSAEKSTNFVIDIELYHLCLYHHFPDKTIWKKRSGY